MEGWTEKTALTDPASQNKYSGGDYESCKTSSTTTPTFLQYFLRWKNTRPKAERTVGKDGIRNLHPINLHYRGRKLAADIFTTLLELQWRWILVTCCVSYFGSWLFFAGWWYLVVYVHGDLERINDPTWTPCVTNVQGFVSIFLFSVETQHTIGYGFYHVTEECPAGVILLGLQSIVGVLIEGLVVGLVFLKMSRTKKRSETILFSRKAVICHRDGRRFFMFRVADTRQSHLMEAHVRAQLLIKKITREGERITQSQLEFKVSGEGENDGKILLFWPTTMVHEIDSSSPLKDLTPSDMNPQNGGFEIIVILEGVVETTGLMTQARSSYAPQEIQWGSRFEEVVFTKSSSGQRIIDYSVFDATLPESLINED